MSRCMHARSFLVLLISATVLDCWFTGNVTHTTTTRLHNTICTIHSHCTQIEAVYEGLLSTGTVAAAMQQQHPQQQQQHSTAVTQLSVTPVLTGSASRVCAAVLRELRTANKLFELYSILYDFFGGCEGCTELWSTVAHCSNGFPTASAVVPPQGQVEVPGLDLVCERVVHVSQLVPRAQVLSYTVYIYISCMYTAVCMLLCLFCKLRAAVEPHAAACAHSIA